MRIGLIADLHANPAALEAVLAELLPRTERILCAGDLTGYYTEPNEVIRMLMRAEVSFIIGNHDRYIEESPESTNAILARSIELTRERLSPDLRSLLAKRDPTLRLELDGRRIAMFHGSPWDPLEAYVYPDYPDFDLLSEVDADVIVLGHTHRPFAREVAGRLVVNPGSCGQSRDGDPRASCAILDTMRVDVTFVRVAYDNADILNEIKRFGLDDRLARYLAPMRPSETAPKARSHAAGRTCHDSCDRAF
ncbi:MAG: metallophosphoesterase family protein [Phycisphaerae bacterium]|nr:metallophosphoesterase family protein [Phycisphaerae bacterium]